MVSRAHAYVKLDKIFGALRFLVGLAMVAFFAGGGYYIFSRSTPPKGIVDPTLTGEDGIKTRITGFKLREKTGNDDYWVVDARNAVVTDSQMELEDVKVGFTSKDKKETSFNLTSKNAVMYTRTQNVAFSGGVVVKNPKPITLTTESLDWDARRRIIYSDTPVKLEVDTAMILGRDMTLELDKQKIEINGDVQALFD